MRRRPAIIIAATACLCLALLFAAVVLSRYGEFYAKRYFIERASLDRAGGFPSSGSFHFRHEEPIFASFSHAGDHFVYCRLNTETGTAFYLLRYDQNRRLVDSQSVYLRGTANPFLDRRFLVTDSEDSGAPQVISSNFFSEVEWRRLNQALDTILTGQEGSL